MMAYRMTANHAAFNVRIAMGQQMHARHVPQGVFEVCKEIHAFVTMDIMKQIQIFALNATLHVKPVMDPSVQTV
jgi:hypothetical protein